MAAWNPAQYLRFADYRARPALELLARIPIDAPRRVWDLGCGTGAVAIHMAHRWPQAHVWGVDGSAAMLERARNADGADRVTWLRRDIADWSDTADLIFSNAALQWVDKHHKVFPHLMDCLSPGGVLATQMPRNYRAASHTALIDVVMSDRWRERLARHLRLEPVAEPAYYYDLLAPRARLLDIWETEYCHVLEGDNPVLEWTKGTLLRPFLEALDDGTRPSFLRDYGSRIKAAYPPRADGRTILPFRRLFLLALKG